MLFPPAVLIRASLQRCIDRNLAGMIEALLISRKVADWKLELKGSVLMH
jgi:hypothetical protein